MPEKEASVYFIVEKAYNKGNSIHFTASPEERAPPLPGPFWVTGFDGGGWGGAVVKCSTRSPVPVPALMWYVIQDENLQSELNGTQDFRLRM